MNSRTDDQNSLWIAEQMTFQKKNSRQTNNFKRYFCIADWQEQLRLERTIIHFVNLQLNLFKRSLIKGLPGKGKVPLYLTAGNKLLCMVYTFGPTSQKSSEQYSQGEAVFHSNSVE